ncbi:hypothetical protein M404DRAFT_759010 [Pisolithus tinctorius Marx 270]|uniref:Uncharacterized protein n=1 Tax=Pisolithus tinctorius Marx 270 TaxID=870435 RepID=A0A0C3NZI4_PISTI|nr:hypothetical protein M404DRAFT_759010 [Pisolithus tinctorius Marx 270]
MKHSRPLHSLQRYEWAVNHSLAPDKHLLALLGPPFYRTRNRASDGTLGTRHRVTRCGSSSYHFVCTDIIWMLLPVDDAMSLEHGRPSEGKTILPAIRLHGYNLYRVFTQRTRSNPKSNPRSRQKDAYRVSPF